jgi:hypothetical protein
VATVMVLSGLMLMVGLTMASTTIFNLSATTREGNMAIAEDLAESALQEAIAKLASDNSYGEGTTAPPAIVVSDPALPPRAEGILTFDSTSGEAYSTNNRTGNDDVGWNGRAVPDRKVHLIGTGRCQGVTKRVEMMVHVPKFPLVMGSEGGIYAEDCLVGSLPDPSAVTVGANGSITFDEKKLDRGDLVSNGSVTLAQMTKITGSVRAAGGINLAGGSQIEGEVLAPYDRADIPTVDITKYDPASDPDVFYDDRPAASIAGDQVVGGVVRYSGSLALTGKLQLDNAIVYVAGNLKVDGGIHGVGAVFTTGNAQLGGGNRIDGRDNVALMANGTVKILGDLNAASIFQGMVYSQGKFEAEHMNLIGTFVSAAALPVAFELKDCKLLYTGLTAAPTVVRSVDTVAARFNNGAQRESYKATFSVNDRGYLVGKPTATYLNPNVKSVQDVLKAANASNWEVTDPCVLHFEYSQVQDKWLTSLMWWGRGEVSDDLPNSTYASIGPLPFDEFKTAFLNSWDPGVASDQLSSGQPAGDVEVGQLLQTMLNQVQVLAFEPANIFQIEPNKFLEDPMDKFRVLYRREL